MDRNRKIVPDSWNLVRERESADHSGTSFGWMPWCSRDCVQTWILTIALQPAPEIEGIRDTRKGVNVYTLTPSHSFLNRK